MSLGTATATDVLVSTDWVKQHLGDATIRVVEVDVDTAAYDQGHVPGSIGWNWTTELCDTLVRDIIPPKKFEELMSKSGIGNDTTVVLYGDNNNWFAAYAYWVARMYGHTDVALMNGGRTKWEAEGRSLTTDATSVKTTRYQAKDLDPTFRAYQRDVQEYVGASGGKALVDVRSPAEFNGDIVAPPGLPETAQRAGHIPGASNIPWGQAVNDDGTFKSADELTALYAAKGVTSDKDVVAYCRIGERSSHSWFVLSQLLGFPKVRNYDGSWTEWGSVIGAPIDNPAASGS
jgi:thiosulfate/3-mercaptopyruvate sulfurtransferase